MRTIYKGVRNYEGRRKNTEYAFDADTAKTLIRNHVHLEEPPEWIEMDRPGRDGWVLAGTDRDVEVYECRIKGWPPDALVEIDCPECETGFTIDIKVDYCPACGSSLVSEDTWSR